MRGGRPWGVTLIAILTAITGGLCVVVGLAAFGGPALFGGLGGPQLGMAGIYVALAMFALAALTLYFAWAIWNLKSWAWMVLIVSSAISLIISLTGLVRGRSATDLMVLAIDLVVVYYLFRSEVRAAFRRTQISGTHSEETRLAMGLLGRTVDLFIFGGLVGFLTLAVGAYRAIDQGCLTGCGLIILLLSPAALILFVIGGIKYRVWRNGLFLSIFLILSLAFAVSMKKDFMSSGMGWVFALSALLSLIPALLLWQVIMAAASGIEVLRSRTR